MAKIMINSLGSKMYFDDNGDNHREDGPAILRPDGGKFYYKNGSQFGFDVPTDQYGNGTKIWALNEVPSRECGVAADYPSGLKRWQIEGILIWPKL